MPLHSIVPRERQGLTSQVSLEEYTGSACRPFPLGACWPLLSDPQSPHSSPVLLVVDGKVIPGFGAQKEPRSRQKPHPRNPAFTNCQCDHLAHSSLFRTKTPQSPPQSTCSREGSVYPEGKRCYAWTHKPAVTHRLCDTGRVP